MKRSAGSRHRAPRRGALSGAEDSGGKKAADQQLSEERLRAALAGAEDGGGKSAAEEQERGTAGRKRAAEVSVQQRAAEDDRAPSGERRADAVALMDRQYSCAGEGHSRPCRSCIGRWKGALLIGEDGLLLRARPVRETLFGDGVEEQKDQKLRFCLACENFDCHDRQHMDVIQLMRLHDRWVTQLTGQESWAPLFHGVEPCLPGDKRFGRIFPLYPPCGRRCTVCGDKAGQGIYCTFYCKVSLLDADMGVAPCWVDDLLAENFGAPCFADRLCRTFPAVAFCGHCCGSHHRTLVGDPVATVLSGAKGIVRDAAGRLLVLHKLLESRCRAYCAICGEGLTEAECWEKSSLHGCFSWYKVPPQDIMTSDESQEKRRERHIRDSFCIDCRRSFCSDLCAHHVEHRTLPVVSYGDGSLYHCVVLPAASGSHWEHATAFDGIEELPGASSQRLVPIRSLRTTRCACRLVLKDAGSSACSLQCTSTSHEYMIDRSLCQHHAKLT